MLKHEIYSLPKSLADARSVGHNLYYTGKPCAKGHDTYRYVSDRVCSECAKAKVKKAATVGGGNARRWSKKTTAQKTAIYARRKEYYDRTKEERRKEKVRSHNVLKQNKEYVAKRNVVSKQWKLDNPGKVRADTVKRRAAKMQRTPSWLTADDYWMLEQAYELAALRTKLFGFSWHVDHVLPLQGKKVSGFHVPTNVQVIPGVENVKKANRYIPA